MIRLVRRVEENGNIERLMRIEENCWIDMESPSNDEIEKVCDYFAVPKDIVTDSLDEDEIPRIVKSDRYVFIIVRVPVEEENSIFTIPLGIILLEKNIITVHSRSIDILNSFFEGEIAYSTTKKVRFLLVLLKRIIEEYTHLLRVLEKRVRELEKEFLRRVKNEHILILMGIKENVLDIQNAIHENNKILEAILAGHYIKLYRGDVEIINDIIIDNRQCITMSSFLIKNVNNALQIFEWIVSNNMNMLMKKLTSIAVILSIPVIISGIYGMNVSLPLQNSPIAFPLLMLISLILMLAVFIYFKKQSWI